MNSAQAHTPSSEAAPPLRGGELLQFGGPGLAERNRRDRPGERALLLVDHRCSRGARDVVDDSHALEVWISARTSRG